MSELNEENVKYLSQLSRIAVNESDIPHLLKHLQQIVSYVDQLQEVDVSNLSPYAHIEAQDIASLREDVVTDLLPREKFLKNSPETIGGMIKVPPVIRH